MSFVIGFVLGSVVAGGLVALFRLERCLLLIEASPPPPATPEPAPTRPVKPPPHKLGRRTRAKDVPPSTGDSASPRT